MIFLSRFNRKASRQIKCSLSGSWPTVKPQTRSTSIAVEEKKILGESKNGYSKNLGSRTTKVSSCRVNLESSRARVLN